MIWNCQVLTRVLLFASAALVHVASTQDIVYKLDFSQQPDGPANKWLKRQGFEFQDSAFLPNGFKDPNKIKLYFEQGRLYVDTFKPAFGVAIKNQVIGDSSQIRITWGVDRFPQQASYEGGQNDEAVMVIVYFGDAKFSSGSVFVLKKLPYFIGVFPSQLDKLGKHYPGKLYKSCGRYACIEKPEVGEKVVSAYDLAANFKAQFKQDFVPPIKGLALEVDTKESGAGGKAKAFIEKIEFLK